MKILCYNIKFAERASEISVIGPNALELFIHKTDMNSTGKLPYTKYAEKSTDDINACEVEIMPPDNWLDNLDIIESRAKEALERKTSFRVSSFDYRIK